MDERLIEFGHATAKVDDRLCIMCGRCTSQTFCSNIHVVDGRVEVLETCDGCGLCVAACPTSPVKALSLAPAVGEHEGVHQCS